MKKIAFSLTILFLICGLLSPMDLVSAQGSKPNDINPLVSQSTSTLTPMVTATQQTSKLTPTINKLTPTITGTQPPPTLTATQPPPMLTPVIVSTPLPEDVLLFSKLGYTAETIMRSPFDSFYLGFGVPVDWELTPGAKLVLHMDMVFSKAPNNGQNTLLTGVLGGTINVSYNGVFIGNIPISDNGSKTYTFDLPMEALKPREGGIHALYLFLDAAINCYYDWFSNVQVKMDSYVQLPHNSKPPVLDLSQLPIPLFQKWSFKIVPVNMIIPDKPTAEELKASLSVAAGLGRLTQNKLVISTYNASSANEQVLKSGHLIFIGKPSSFPSLASLPFAAKINQDSFDLPYIAADDGVVQMINSPWNVSSVLLFISGTSDLGVVKAGQAFSSGNLRPGDNKNLSVIANLNSFDNQGKVPIDLTFETLGSKIIQLQNLGISTESISFNLPVDKVIDADTYINLTYNHSQVIDYDRSGLLISINNIPVSSLRLNDDNSNVNTVKIQIPVYTLNRGINTITIQSELYPKAICTDLRSGSLWVNVYPDSKLHLPIRTDSADIISVSSIIGNLNKYPAPFSANSRFKDVVFILPDNLPAAWDSAVKVAYDLGFRTGSGYYQPDVMFSMVLASNNSPETILKDKLIILIGKSEMLAGIPAINNVLPAPFDSQSNAVIEKSSNIIYRFPLGFSLGYIQIAPSPWNANRQVMAIIGSSDEGLTWATSGLTTPDMRAKLSGSFVAFRENQIVVGEDQASQTLAEAPFATPVVIVKTQTPIVPSGSHIPNIYGEMNQWILPALAITLGLIVVVLILMAIISFRNRKK